MPRAWARWLVPQPVGGWTTDAAVTVSTSTDATGARLHVVHNWGWDEATPSTGTRLTDLHGGTTYDAGSPVPLGPWDVRVLRSS